MDRVIKPAFFSDTFFNVFDHPDRHHGPCIEMDKLSPEEIEKRYGNAKCPYKAPVLTRESQYMRRRNKSE